MSVTQRMPNRHLERPAPSSLADVIDTILDKGLMIDIYGQPASRVPAGVDSKDGPPRVWSGVV
jgi:hypothetical protein